jgi:hypothetical protein
VGRRGISLLDLVAPFPGSQAVIPDDLASRLENLAAVAVNVHVGSVDISNVVAVSGSRDAPNLLEFDSAANPADAAKLRWRHGEGSDAHTRTGPDFVLNPSSEPGTSYIVVTDTENRTRRVRVDVLPERPLLIGAADGVHDATGRPLRLLASQWRCRSVGVLLAIYAQEKIGCIEEAIVAVCERVLQRFAV